jgi:hypothetical protein
MKTSLAAAALAGTLAVSASAFADTPVLSQKFLASSQTSDGKTACIVIKVDGAVPQNFGLEGKIRHMWDEVAAPHTAETIASNGYPLFLQAKTDMTRALKAEGLTVYITHFSGVQVTDALPCIP